MEIHPGIAGFGAGITVCGAVLGLLWHQLLGRIERLQADVDGAGKSLRECIEARGELRSEVRLLRERLDAVENGHPAGA